MTKPTRCRHCRLRKICRPRRLCKTCFGDPDVRRIYPRAPLSDAPPCVHCQVRYGGQARGLCGRCLHLPGVREQYGVRCHRGYTYEPIYPAAAPTDTLPGTAEREAVYRERARLRQHLFHPDDRVILTGRLARLAAILEVA